MMSFRRVGVLAGGAVLCALLGVGCDALLEAVSNVGGWTRHTIAANLRGADGVKLGDANGNGLADLVVPWEESGRVVVYFNPGPAAVQSTWPSVVVGTVGDPEDALFVDLDADGRRDVVSACEGSTKAVYVHWAPPATSLLDSTAWQTAVLPASQGRAWLMCEPAQIDGVRGVDLVAGSKDTNAQIGYFAAPADPRDLAAWTWVPLADASWIMSILPVDLDGDGDTDLVYTDRKGTGRGCYWLENPGGGAATAWNRYLIGTSADELMFADIGDVNGDGILEIFAATSGRALLRWQPVLSLRLPWTASEITWDDSYGTGKGLALGDLDGDGLAEIVFSCENAGSRYGVGRVTPLGIPGVGGWTTSPISDNAGSKFDQVRLADLDADGDLDVLTTEESDGLGVIWYENPAN